MSDSGNTSRTKPEVIDTDASARLMDADEHIVAFEAAVTIRCHCGAEVEIHTMQKSVVCQGPEDGNCGQEWRLR